MDRWNEKELIQQDWISNKIDQSTVDFAKKFGKYLAKDDMEQVTDKFGKPKMNTVGEKLTTSQLRKFFGEVKRQQILGYNESSFVMLSPKLAYAVGRAKKNMRNGVKYCKIEDFLIVFEDAIKQVVNSENKDKAFKNFIEIYEAIVAFHKAAE